MPRYNVYGLAINPVWIPTAREHLRDSEVHIVGVVGFPLGANRTDVKIDEAVRAVSDGAREIDMSRLSAI